LLLVLLGQLFSIFPEGVASEGCETAGDSLGKQGHLLVGGWRQRHEHEWSGARGGQPGGEESIWNYAMRMRIEVQCPAKSLKKGNRTGLSVGDPQSPTAVALPGKDDAQKSGEHFAKGFRMAGEPVAQVKRE
jgi:hypothetical protein